jgi:hypothetical protein
MVVPSPWGDDPPPNAPTARGAHPSLLRLVDNPWSHRSSVTPPPTEDVQLRRRRQVQAPAPPPDSPGRGYNALHPILHAMPKRVRARLRPLRALASTLTRRVAIRNDGRRTHQPR